MRVTVATVALFAGACASAPTLPASLAEGSSGGIAGLADCGGGELQLDPRRPLVVFVPGQGDPGDRWIELAWRFEAQGAQAACFRYDDRERLGESGARLAAALEQLEARLEPGRITILAHGKGGLLARRALVAEQPRPLRSAPGFSYALVAVATPFNGLKSAADCGRTWLHVLTLGTSALVCSMVSGEAWADLPPRSPFIRNPGTLVPEVAEAIGVVTVERGTCRRRTPLGACDESDAVFSVGEQRNATVEADPRWERVEVAAGHDEIVGALGTPPHKLFAVLEAQGILEPRPARMARP